MVLGIVFFVDILMKIKKLIFVKIVNGINLRIMKWLKILMMLILLLR